MRGYSRALWRAIQAVVGEVEDGEPGPATARAIAEWQGEHGLSRDGAAGPKTLKSLARATGRVEVFDPPPPPVCLWFDHSGGMEPARALRLFAGLGVERVCFMLDDAPEAEDGDEPEWKHTPAELAELGDAAREVGLEVEAAIWPRPRAAHLEALVEGLAPRVEALRPCRLQLDVEGNWRERHLDGFPSLEAAAVEVARRISEATGGIAQGVTSYPLHGEFGTPSVATFDAGLAAFEIPQAYSRLRKGDPQFAVGEVYGPRRMQGLAADRAATAGGASLELGLAAWDQQGLYETAEQAMIEAYDAARLTGARRVWLWSSKHVVANGYARKLCRRVRHMRASRCS